ncbi:hypothetical protein C8Q78DRAFT_50944 [Trametes maxima]|nr:hypothetical protein C8Q78DRAFT_50944 [Trametes maxima]
MRALALSCLISPSRTGSPRVCVPLVETNYPRSQRRHGVHCRKVGSRIPPLPRVRTVLASKLSSRFFDVPQHEQTMRPPPYPYRFPPGVRNPSQHLRRGRRTRCHGPRDNSYSPQFSCLHGRLCPVWHAAILDYITSAWAHERKCFRSLATWSPMPWSRASLKELSELHPASEAATHNISDSCREVLPVPVDANPSGLRPVRLRYGSPVGIHWLNGTHDGFPFCPTLPRYAAERRTGTMPSFQDDAATWLGAMTFGLLEALTRSRIPESMLLVPGTCEGELVLSDVRILWLLVIWHDGMHRKEANFSQDGAREAHRQHRQEAIQLLDRALRALDEEAFHTHNILHRAGISHRQASDILSAIAFTLVAIDAFMRCVWKDLPNTLHTPYVLNVMRSSCKEKMCRAGWCSSTISSAFLSRYSTFQNCIGLSNLVQLSPFIRSSIDEHKECTESTCVFYTFTDTSYVRRHVHPSCCCEYVKPPLDDITGLLAKGIVPVVVYDGEKLSVKSTSDTAFVAISHVWADGMGSTSEVGLPTCVVKRIAALAKTLLPESGAFWLDSLCVPARRDSRKLALRHMARSYRDAAMVLVIDECIRTQCSENKTWEENLCRIKTSGWVRRIWTLQEGLLARELYFEFNDGLVDVEHRLGLKPAPDPNCEPQNDKPKQDRSGLWDRLVPSLLAFRGRNWSVKAGRPIALHEVIELLHMRTTTKAEDEIIAISSLLPLDVDALLAISGPDVAQRRMKEFLLQMGQVSKGLPMTPKTSRLTLPKYTWAPRTLGTTLGSTCYYWGVGTCTPDGLLAEYLVAPLDKPIVISPGEWKGWAVIRYVSTSAEETSFVLTTDFGGSSEDGLTASLTIDALLLPDRGIEDCTTSCAAVTRIDASEAAKVNNSQDTPHRYSYVGSCSLCRRHGTTRAPPDAILGEMGQKWVLLS